MCAVGFKRLRLTQCRRSDQALFEWYVSLGPGGSRYELPLADILAEARLRFPARGTADHHLCLSHNIRKRVSKMVQKARKGGLKILGKPPLGQPMWIQPGTRLICAMEQSRAGLWNSQLLTVTAHDAETVNVKCLDTGAEHSLSHSSVAERTRLGWRYTIASAQGRTLEGRVAIHDTRHPRFSIRHLTTTLSRARSAELVSIED